MTTAIQTRKGNEMDAVERIRKIIAQVESDIAMHERLLGEADTDEGRAYQQRQIDGCRAQLAKRQAMLVVEVAESN